MKKSLRIIAVFLQYTNLIVTHTDRQTVRYS